MKEDPQAHPTTILFIFTPWLHALHHPLTLQAQTKTQKSLQSYQSDFQLSLLIHDGNDNSSILILAFLLPFLLIQIKYKLFQLLGVDTFLLEWIPAKQARVIVTSCYTEWFGTYFICLKYPILARNVDMQSIKTNKMMVTHPGASCLPPMVQTHYWS